MPPTFLQENPEAALSISLPPVLTPAQYKNHLEEIEVYLDELWIEATSHLEVMKAGAERWDSSESDAGRAQAALEVTEAIGHLMVRQLRALKMTISLIQLMKAKP